MAMPVDNEAAFLWTCSECPAHPTGRIMKACRNLTVFTALISERWCLSCREELILSKEEAVSPRIVMVHNLGLTEDGRERYRNVKLPILFDQAYLLQSLHPCGFDSTQSMCCLEGSVWAQWDYLMEMKEMARKSAQSEATGRGRGKSLVFRHTLFWQACHQSHLLWLLQRTAVLQAWKQKQSLPREALQH